MKKAAIFGATANLERIRLIQESYDIVFATDNDESKYGKMLTDDIMIINKNELYKGEYDYVVITSLTGQNEIYSQLISDFHIEDSRIIRNYVDFPPRARIQFLKSFSQMIYEKNIQGSVCEVGVFRGEFAKEINKYFPDRTCYLFDTFNGFDLRDIKKEIEAGYSSKEPGHLRATSIDLVLSKMIYRENCIIKKGYFPESFDIPNEKFCFVNLDVDLYNPILAGLKIFYPRLLKGGIILVHDYFHPSYKGVKSAVDEFSTNENIELFPIGDGISIAILHN